MLLPHGSDQENKTDEIDLDLIAKAGFNPAQSVQL